MKEKELENKMRLETYGASGWTRKGLLLGGGGLAFFAAFAIVIAVVVGYQEPHSILIQSHESKTRDGQPVFNEIRWFKRGNRDIWMMRQSHDGLAKPRDQWDRLAIVVDRSQSPPRARFLQTDPGELEWSDDLLQQRRPYRASCFMCHANGLRLVRPIGAPELSIWDRARLFTWNLKIKSYGRVLPALEHETEDAHLPVPFRYPSEVDNETLNVRACNLCHRDHGPFARGVLRRQQSKTIQFLADAGYMPLFGLPLPESDRQALQMFLQGF